MYCRLIYVSPTILSGNLRGKRSRFVFFVALRQDLNLGILAYCRMGYWLDKTVHGPEMGVACRRVVDGQVWCS